MKRLIAFLLIFAMLAAFMTGCTTTPPEETPSTEDPGTGSTPEPTDPWANYECITIAKALELCGEPGNITEDRYYIRATVASVDNPQYGAMTITDGTDSIYVYGTYSQDGSISYSEMNEKPYAGDEVLLHCILQNYNGTKEVKNARLIDFIPAELDVDTDGYTEMSIAQARNAAAGDQVQVSGVVAQITYAFGQVPSGVILVDNTSSIYIYSKDIAGRVSIGNTITVAASKTYWILEDEQTNAAKFGYLGCSQLEDATLVSIDNTSSSFDTSWVEEITVKELLDTPVTEDITSKIYKTTAVIHKVEGTGFTNYYIDDLDDTTGTYCYSQCNGSDYSWLDEFDGKICTVYLTALNAKSTNSDCFWRLLPITVSDDGFDVSTVNVAEHAVKYYGVTQFLPSYTGNPALALTTSVDSELLKFTDAKLSYSSSDTSVISIDSNMMNCKKSGTATITVTGTYGDQTYSEDVTITVDIQQQEITYSTVADAIAAAVGETVTVKGIVGPSLVNKTGFYLIDETGVVAVEMDEKTLATLEIGYEVILEGVRQINTKGGTNYYGQTTIKDCQVIVNNYGSHDYSTASFDGDISAADFYNLDVTKDYSTSVFTMKATVVLEETQYYTSIYLSDGTTKVRLYCSGAGQYSWLKQFAGQEVTVEIAPCNWNDKNYYVGCVLAVVHDDGTKTINTLNFN